eukprot:Rmarinus@m.4567
MLSGRKRPLEAICSQPKRYLCNMGSTTPSISSSLLRREVCRHGNRVFLKNCSRAQFQEIKLQAEIDTFNPDVPFDMAFLRRRSRVLEIAATDNFIFALNHNGVCTAFNTENHEAVCVLNTSRDEVIRSLFHNKVNDSIITVSVYSTEQFACLRCKSIPMEYIRRKQPSEALPLFEGESLQHPGFVEFDDVNAKVLTFSADVDRVYKVWDLVNYKLLYKISDRNIREIKISPGIMLLIYERSRGSIPLRLLSMEDGSVLKDFHHILNRNKKVDFVEQFNDKLLIKQENENLHIINVKNGDLLQIPSVAFPTPSAFIFLYENSMFLTFRNRNVSIWNFKGELVTKFEDQDLWHSDNSTNNVYITSNQDLIISYCRPKKGSCRHNMESIRHGTINISSIRTGKLVNKITCASACDEVMIGKAGMTRRMCCEDDVVEALVDVTSLYFNESRNEIYTGSKKGLIYCWSRHRASVRLPEREEEAMPFDGIKTKVRKTNHPQNVHIQAP